MPADGDDDLRRVHELDQDAAAFEAAAHRRHREDVADALVGEILGDYPDVSPAGERSLRLAYRALARREFSTCEHVAEGADYSVLIPAALGFCRRCRVAWAAADGIDRLPPITACSLCDGPADELVWFDERIEGLVWITGAACSLCLTVLAAGRRS